jgi:phospholipid/cholesterol/gamma-HCH transport system ATP-binding protein
MAEPLIELKGIHKAFGGKKILDGIDLSIYKGEAVAIIGPSGTGKSTILRIIAGLLAPDAGEIYICGHKRLGLAEDADDPIGIGMVFQNTALFDSLTVDENVGFLLYQHSRLPHDKIRQLVTQKLEMVGLSGINNSFPAELSGGMKKRVSLARAIMENPEKPNESPEVLLYDEPTAGLDPIASTVVEDLIRDLQCKGGTCNTYVIVTHQDSTIRRTSDRTIVLYRGQIQWDGPTAEIDHVDNPIVRQFFSGSIEGPIRVMD